MELNINLDTYLENNAVKVDITQFQKMLLLFNAVEDGWTLKKRNSSYVFTKNHEGKKEVLHDDYLIEFMRNNLIHKHKA